MPNKGMKTLLLTFKSKPSYSPSSSPGDASPASYSLASTPRRNTESMIERSIAKAELLVTKWNPNTSGYAQVTSLFQESHQEAMDFIKCVFNLQKSMHMISHDDPFGNMERAQNFMQIAMKRLQKEFYQILSTNRAHLDPESVSTRSSRTSSISSISDFDDITTEEESTPSSVADMDQVSILAMDNLRTIAECMISSGYAKECIKIYKIIRKSIIDEGLYKLHIEKTTQNHFNKLTWETQDLKIQQWLHASKIALKTLFAGERILCDHVFESSDAIRESCFAEISKEGANLLFSFPEIVAKSKKSADTMVRVLDMYTVITELLSDINTIFSSNSSSSIRTLVTNSLSKLADAVKSMFQNFESSVQKDSLKATTAAADGGVDPLTTYVMNNLSCLSDYANVLNEILSDHPLPGRSSNFETSSNGGEAPLSTISVHMAWMIFFLLRKLDDRSSHYKHDVISTSHLFLANNLQHVVSTVRKSNLKFILGERWIRNQEEKIDSFIVSYYSSAWGGVVETLPENTVAISTSLATERFIKFKKRFEEAYRKQSRCVVEDQKLRDAIRVYVAGKIVPRYSEFFGVNKNGIEEGKGAGDGSLSFGVRFTPEDVSNYLLDLYFDDEGFESSSPISFPSSSLSLS